MLGHLNIVSYKPRAGISFEFFVKLELTVIPRFTIMRFSITRFFVLVQKNLYKDKDKSLIEIFFNIFQNIFCLYYDLYNANFDLRGFWAATTTA